MLAFQPIKRSLDFAGRSGRREMFHFAVLMATVVMVGLVIDIRDGRADAIGGIAGPATVVAVMTLLLPLVALMARRMHDVGRPATWLAMGLVPIIGQMWLAGWFAVEGDRGANRFGIDPKGEERRAALAH